MKPSALLLRPLMAASTLMVVLSAYWLWARPNQLHWGATDEEIARAMPGDELDPDPSFLATRAITINGTPAEIYPWLVQMGYTRAGFYGYDILENVGSPRGIESADRIIPALQGFQVGDEVPISAVARMQFYALEPDQYVIWTDEDEAGGFTWALYPKAEGRTRLVSRIRWSYNVDEPGDIALQVLTEFADHLAVRKLLKGIKERVGGGIQPLALNTAEFMVYLISSLTYAAALVLMLVRPATWRRWLAGMAAGAGWLITWYAPIAAWLGVPITVGVVWLLRRAFFGPSSREADTQG